MKDDIIAIKNMLTQYKHGGNITSFPPPSPYLDSIIELLYSKKLIDDYDLSFLSKLYKLEHYIEIQKPNIKDESILCILDRHNLLINMEYLKNDLDSLVSYIEKVGVYVDRRFVEFNSDIVQIIPYMMVIHNDKLLLLKKKKNKGDVRVANKIDFPAGHCSKSNRGIVNSIMKELNEELGINKEDIKNINIVNTIPISKDIFSVSYYHLALIYSIELYDDAKILNNEPDKHDILYYEDIDDITNILGYFDNWVLYGINTYNNIKNKNRL